MEEVFTRQWDINSDFPEEIFIWKPVILRMDFTGKNEMKRLSGEKLNSMHIAVVEVVTGTVTIRRQFSAR
jgi:hypothetical protein